ncbi:hypothetical protein A3J78_00315 [Candidatus Beckwithbacteria bacterium RBG_13_35_6]|uniref:Uncharacterized protein n=1 Tax=Candidatus Beckwithbacteria bacterium RBG_13_35_6 TaxID=1797456 RepID=A0A1F5DEY1_9BACT|nr:MAG: hypothetical protein A3J78_00315 [Candidatus Beckwithbacteria bacterium RBG_13_35_6]
MPEETLYQRLSRSADRLKKTQAGQANPSADFETSARYTFYVDDKPPFKATFTTRGIVDPERFLDGLVIVYNHPRETFILDGFTVDGQPVDLGRLEQARELYKLTELGFGIKVDFPEIVQAVLADRMHIGM